MELSLIEESTDGAMKTDSVLTIQRSYNHAFELHKWIQTFLKRMKLEYVLHEVIG